MFRIVTLITFLALSMGLQAQDYLVVPSSNPSLFPKNMEYNRDKLLYQVDTVVYEYDSLDLPFVDDFTSDHFPALIKDPANDPRVKDSLFHAILLLNGQVYQGDDGFSKDSTFTYTVDNNGDTISTSANPIELIRYFNLSTYPPSFEILNTFPVYNITDTLGGGSDSVKIEPFYVQDSIRYYIVEKDTESYYLDRSVYRNYTMGFYPPSLGVATFDGLNQYGLPYNFNDISTNGRADQLTSVPIKLDGTSDSTYFSFFYQAKGFALDGPSQEDSLSLEFYNSTTKRWGLIWQSQGIPITAPVDSFRQVMIRVDSQFRTNGFQFRFRNRARLSGAFDNWHIDYIYLDDNRSIANPSTKDISYAYQATGLLKDYEVMPSWHFKTDPSIYMVDNVELLVRNNHKDPLLVFNKIILYDTINNTNYYIWPGPDQFLQIPAFGSLAFTYPINFSYPSEAIDSFQVFKGTCDIDFRPAPIETKDFIRANDTTYATARLKDFYAYDDGTAEAGYGVVPLEGSVTTYMAVRFDMPFRDTLGGVMMYFLPQANDIRSQSFILTVWSSLSPSGIVYQKEVRSKAIYDEKDAYIPYFFDSLLLVGPTFYVGYQKIGKLSMNVGYDLNRNHRDKINWSYDGINWVNPSNNIRDGSIMIRPILRKRNFDVGITESIAPKVDLKQALRAYPNPGRESFRLIDPPTDLKQLRMISFDGRLAREFDPRSDVYSIAGLSKGVYILHGLNDQGESFTTKFIVTDQ